jgi:hypothetical protein
MEERILAKIKSLLAERKAGAAGGAASEPAAPEKPAAPAVDSAVKP